MGKHRDWTEIAAEYQESGTSLAALAKKYGIPIDTIKKAAARQGWTKTIERRARSEKRKLKSVGKALETVSQTAPNGTEETAPKRTDETAPAPVEIVLEAEDPRTAFQRLVKEMMDRMQEAVHLVDPGDAQSLKMLTGALKDLQSLQGIKSDLDIEEQKARIAKLRSETVVRDDGDSQGGVVVRFIDTNGAEG